jgi:hypothetical protein
VAPLSTVGKPSSCNSEESPPAPGGASVSTEGRSADPLPHPPLSGGTTISGVGSSVPAPATSGILSWHGF